MTKIKPATVNEYIDSAPEYARMRLREMRSILREVAPEAEEQLKWGNPVFVEKRILFAFTAYKLHMNFMPTGQSLEPFRDELSEYVTGKDTVRFSYDKPLPKELIKKIAQHRLMDVRVNDAKWMY